MHGSKTAYWIQEESTVLAINFSHWHVAHFPDTPATLQRLHRIAGDETSSCQLTELRLLQFSLAWEQGSWEFTSISLMLFPRPLPAPASHAKGQGP